MINYKYKKEQVKVEGRIHNTYSILCYKGNELIQKITDAFATKEAANSFVEMCNRYMLEPIHLLNVLDDYL